MLKFPIAQLKWSGVLRSLGDTVQLTKLLPVCATSEMIIFMSLLRRQVRFSNYYAMNIICNKFTHLTTDSINCCPIGIFGFKGAKNSLVSYLFLMNLSFSSPEDVGTLS